MDIGAKMLFKRKFMTPKCLYHYTKTILVLKILNFICYTVLCNIYKIILFVILKG